MDDQASSGAAAASRADFSRQAEQVTSSGAGAVSVEAAQCQVRKQCQIPSCGETGSQAVVLHAPQQGRQSPTGVRMAEDRDLLAAAASAKVSGGRSPQTAGLVARQQHAPTARRILRTLLQPASAAAASPAGSGRLTGPSGHSFGLQVWRCSRLSWFVSRPGSAAAPRAQNRCGRLPPRRDAAASERRYQQTGATCSSRATPRPRTRTWWRPMARSIRRTHGWLNVAGLKLDEVQRTLAEHLRRESPASELAVSLLQ